MGTRRDHSAWLPERLAQLADLWGQGLSASKIGLALGVSKHAVIGAAHRSGLPQRPSPIIVRPAGEVKRPAKAAAQRVKLLAAAQPQPHRPPPPPVIPASVHPAKACQFPLWGNRERPRVPRFCSKPIGPKGGSWCAECRAVVLVRVQLRPETQERLARQFVA